MCLVAAPVYSTLSMGYLIAHGAREDLENYDLRNIGIGMLVGSLVFFALAFLA